MSAYRTAAVQEPIPIEPERPWFPRELEYVRIVASDFHAGQIGRVGYVSAIKGQVYLISFPHRGEGKGPSKSGLFFLQELAPHEV